MCRATYVLRQEGRVEAIVCLHVDDGFVVASKKTLVMLKKRISEKFCIKEWQDLSEKPVTILGVKTSYVNGVFYMTCQSMSRRSTLRKSRAHWMESWKGLNCLHFAVL